MPGAASQDKLQDKSHDKAQDKAQDKTEEIAFFDRHAAADDYNVFTPASNARLIACFSDLTGLPAGSRVADLGCGSGVFTQLLRQAGYNPVGLDLSPMLIAAGRAKYPGVELLEGDIEALPFADNSLDGVLLAGVVHHFPDPSRCAAEMHRVLRPGGKFMAFDPNRRNPFMWAYRDRSSILYSPVGVTVNERPVVAEEVRAVFRQAGFAVTTDYLSGMSYRYVASARARRFLAVYNFIDTHCFKWEAVRAMRAFVLTSGEKL